MNEQLYAMLSETRNLDRIQEYIGHAMETRGFNAASREDMLLLMTEKLGSLAKKVRKESDIVSIDIDKADMGKSAEEEAADMFIALLSLCNSMEISLYKSFLEKEKKNLSRSWANEK